VHGGWTFNVGVVEGDDIKEQEGVCVIGSNLNVDSSSSESETDDSGVDTESESDSD